MLNVLTDIGKPLESDQSKPVSSCIQSILLNQAKLLFSESYRFDNVESLTSLVIRVFIFRKLGKMQVFDRAFFETHPEL